MRINTSVVILVVILSTVYSTRAVAQNPCDPSELVLGDASGHPGEQVTVELYGGAGCEVTGYSLGVGHDPDVLQFLGAAPGPAIVDHSGPDLSFQVSARNAEGYVLLGALFDISFPVTVPPVTLESGTVLATLSYEILPEAPPGQTTLLNRSRTYGRIPMSNIFSRPPGEIPVEPVLVDGTITIQPPPVLFRRADFNGDGALDVSDVVCVLLYMFRGFPTPSCEKAGDIDDNGTITVTDAIYLLFFAYLQGPEPPSPFAECGTDPTPDDLSCLHSPLSC